MNKKLLLLFFALALPVLAVSYSTMDRGLLDGNAQVSFSNGSAITNFTDGNSFYIQGYGDRVEFENGIGQDWVFSNSIANANDLSLVKPNNFEEVDISTIIGTALHEANKVYSIGYIKIKFANQETLRIVRIKSVVPELQNFSLLLGIASLAFIALHRRSTI